MRGKHMKQKKQEFTISIIIMCVLQKNKYFLAHHLNFQSLRQNLRTANFSQLYKIGVLLKFLYVQLHIFYNVTLQSSVCMKQTNAFSRHKKTVIIINRFTSYNTIQQHSFCIIFYLRLKLPIFKANLTPLMMQE